MDFFIGVASHKDYMMPQSNIYIPVQVGASNHKRIKGFTPDDSGKNISSDNPYFSELTALYYIWKNSDAQVKGLVHYRRYLGNGEGSSKDPFSRILRFSDINEILKDHEVILPKKRHYYIETNYSHYVHAHHEEALVYLHQILKRREAEYGKSFEKIMKRRSAHMFNMMIMKGPLFDEYCSWLFPILFSLEKELDISTYDTSEARVFGYVSELLMDVWLDITGHTYFEAPVVYVEGQHLPIKMISFLRRKILGSGTSHVKSSVDSKR